MPVFINRCGVLAGAGQFGRADQGIFAYWLNAHLRQRPLRYIGFGGHGHQVRDCLHPRDLAPLLAKQFAAPALPASDRIANFSGGAASARSSLWIGLSAEYRVTRALLAQVGMDPGSAPCTQLGTNGFPRLQFGFDLFREWIF